MRLLQPLFRWEPVEELFSDRARLQGMLDFEAALARAEARTGVIPQNAVAPIAARCRTELFDLDALATAGAPAGNVAIPLVKQLTRLVSDQDVDAARYVHWGATSQDATDTGFILQLRGALERIASELERLSSSVASLTQENRATPMVGRTLMQQALPMTLGLKTAGWLDAVDRHRVRLVEVRRRALVLQFGGAVGSLAALGDKGMAVGHALAEELNLELPAVPWHAHRDRVTEVAATLGLLAGTLGKIARDISLHAQTEFAEVFEPAGQGRGGSSTMPHKRNPVASAVALAAAVRVPPLVSSMLSAMVQEDERGLGGWHAEWETMPEIVSLTAGALHHLADAVAGLEIDPQKMCENLNLTRGLIFAEAAQMALAGKLGRLPAHELVESACRRAQREKRHLREVLAEDAGQHLSEEELARLFDARQYFGVANEFMDRVLAAHAALSRPSAQQ